MCDRVAFSVVNDLDVPDGEGGVSRNRLEYPEETLREALDRVALEKITGVGEGGGYAGG